jgi:hypothetical protein
MGKTGGNFAFMRAPSLVVLCLAGMASCENGVHVAGNAAGPPDVTTSRPASPSAAGSAAHPLSVVGKTYAAARRELLAAGFALLEADSEASTVAGDKAACPADTLICTVQWVDTATRAPLCIQVQVKGSAPESDWPVTDQKNEKCYE